MDSDRLPSDDDIREQRFWGMMLRTLWSCLLVLVLGGVLAVLTLALHWTPYLLLCAVGLMAGSALSLAIRGSARSRELTGLVLGALVLPMLAVWLAGLAATGPDALAAHSAGLIPFLAYAAAAMALGSGIARVWRQAPEQPPEAPGTVTPAKDEGVMP